MDRVAIGRRCCAQASHLGSYAGVVAPDLLEELQALAGQLRGLRICHINSTAAGGGVAELLSREVPFMRALGLTVDWWVLRGKERFYSVTKGFHNALQGASYDLTAEVMRLYEEQNQESARLLDASYDVYVVHDPQPAALARFRRRAGECWIWRCHIDSSAPDPGVWAFLRPFVEDYDAAVFTMREFVPADLKVRRLELVPPAIDPLSTKNMDVPADLARRVVADAGVDLERPLILQVSRFDPWKDPFGALAAYQMVKQSLPAVQLAFVGALVGDDPEGWDMLERVHHAAEADTDVYVLTNQTGVGNVEVNAFQRLADVIVQKSLREGFGLVVSEALWKGRPVVAGRAGGIPMQIPEEHQRFVVATVSECAERIAELLQSRALGEAYGRAGHEHVRGRFLLPRLARDDLTLVRSLR